MRDAPVAEGSVQKKGYCADGFRERRTLSEYNRGFALRLCYGDSGEGGEVYEGPVKAGAGVFQPFQFLANGGG